MTTATVRVSATARHLFGEEWAGALSRYLGVSLRTCQRVKAANEENEDDPRAAGLLAELQSQLSRSALILHDARSHVLVDDDGDVKETERGIRRLVWLVEDARESEERSMIGPFLDTGLSTMLDRAAYIEEALIRLTRSALPVIYNPAPQKDEIEALDWFLDRALDTTNAIYGRRLDGSFELLSPPTELFTTAEDLVEESVCDFLLVCLAGCRKTAEALLEYLLDATAKPDGLSVSVYDRLYGGAGVTNPDHEHYLVGKVSGKHKNDVRRFLQSYGLQTWTLDVRRKGDPEQDGRW
jgi:hypothetical protein